MPPVGPEADPDLATSAGGTSDVSTQPTVAAATAATWSGTGCALLHPTPPELMPGMTAPVRCTKWCRNPRRDHRCVERGKKRLIAAETQRPPPIALDSVPVSIY